MTDPPKNSLPGPSAWENHKWEPWNDQIPIPSVPQMPYDADIINSILNASEAMRLGSFSDRESFPFWREMQASLTPIGRTDENRVYERHRQALQVYSRMAAFEQSNGDDRATAVLNFINAVQESDILFAYVIHHIVINGQGITYGFDQYFKEEGHFDKISSLGKEVEWEYVDQKFPVLREILFMLNGMGTGDGNETRKRAAEVAGSIRTGEKLGTGGGRNASDEGKEVVWADDFPSPVRTESVEARRERVIRQRLQEQADRETQNN